jgi:hypothetical protein
MRDKLIDILWELDNHKYPNYEDKADEIFSLFNVVGRSEQFTSKQLWKMAQKYNADDFIQMVKEIEG